MTEHEDAVLVAIPALALGGGVTTRLVRTVDPAGVGYHLAGVPLAVGLLSALAVIGFETLVRPPTGE